MCTVVFYILTIRDVAELKATYDLNPYIVTLKVTVTLSQIKFYKYLNVLTHHPLPLSRSECACNGCILPSSPTKYFKIPF